MKRLIPIMIILLMVSTSFVNVSNSEEIEQFNRIESNNPPYEPSNPYPTHNSTHITLHIDLAWRGGDPDSNDIVYYHIYFQMDKPDPEYLNTIGPFNATKEWIVYDMNKDLKFLHTYYWKIVVEDNNGSITEGSVWIFSTMKGPNTLYVGGDGPGNYTKIQDAIDNSSDGDTIFVYDDSSPYYENVEVDKSINLIGENRETTVIDGNNVYLSVEISFKWVNISGFTIRNSGIDGSGILLYGFCNFSHNIVTLNNGSGILIRGGIFGNSGYCNVISDNIITCNKCDGIIIGRAEANTITNNTISNNGNGIYASGDLSGLTSDNIISGNNIISNNGYGIALDGDCWNNIIFHNNFINNGENAVAYDWGDVWDNGYPSGGNFWDDYNGTDSDGDGIGDTPYTIDGNGEDRYPLGNFRPDIPMINGQTHGKPGVDYDYTFVTTDPEGDDVWYHICWGDKEKIYIYGPYPSGEEITLTYN